MRRPLAEISPTRGLPAALVATALLALAAGLFLPVIRFPRLLSPDETYSVAGGVRALWEEGERPLAALIFAFSMVLPVVKLLALLVAWFAPLGDRTRRGLLRVLELLGKWSMLDIFVVALLVSTMRIWFVSLARPGVGVYVFGGAILLSLAATFWIRAIAGAASPEPAPAPPGTAGFRRSPVAFVLGLLALAGIVSGFLLPFLTVTKWIVVRSRYSVIDASFALVNDEEYGLAALVLLFVVAAPVVRLLVMLSIYVVPAGGAAFPRLVRAAGWLGRWAMVDVFSLAVAVVFVKLSGAARVERELGGWLFMGGTTAAAAFGFVVGRAVRGGEA